MIKRLRVENFLSLKDTTIDIEPLTILVGPNGAGKSAIFKALIMLSKLLRLPVRGQRGDFILSKRSPLDKLVWKGDDSLPIRFHVQYQGIDDIDSKYMLELRKLTVGWSVTREVLSYKGFQFDSDLDTLQFDTEFSGYISLKPPYSGTLSNLVNKYRRDSKAELQIRPFLSLGEHIGSTWRYRVAASNIAEPVSPFREDSQGIFVGENGYGLPWVLRRLQGENRDVFDTIEKTLNEWFPHIEKIEFEEGKEFGVGISFKTKRSTKSIPAELESDGVVQALFLLWRLYAPESFVTICLEEPESGTHPYYLEKRYEFIKKNSYSNIRKNYQMMLATHSPEFLNAIGSEDALKFVRLVEHDSHSGTKCIALSDLNDVEKLFELFKGNLGEIWWSGVVGGVPRKKHA
jgi:predicted ATPase